MQLYKHVFLSFAIMLVLDLTWLKLMTPQYGKNIKGIQGEPLMVKVGGAAVAYLLMFVSLWAIVYPSIKCDPSKNIAKLSLVYAGLVGFVIYGIYNATNYATLKNYDIGMACVDTLWGTTVYTVSVLLALLILGKP